MTSTLRSCLYAVSFAASLVACRAKPTAIDNSSVPTPSASPSGSSDSPSSKLARAPLIADAAVQAALDPDHLAPYSGPIGRISGVIHVSGDPAPERPDVLAQIPHGKCDDARAFYGKVFREGPGRELGDALVTVTNYKGFVAPVRHLRTVVARGCAFDARTVALTFGERLEVKNKGGETFIPQLIGGSPGALLVAVPGGDAVPLFPEHVGLYALVDRSHPFARADVFVLKFPTFAITGIDGKYEIDDIPGGDVVVSAYLPTIRKTAQANVKVVSGETATVDLTIPFASTAAPASSSH
jgi:hypothetical protein